MLLKAGVVSGLVTGILLTHYEAGILQLFGMAVVLAYSLIGLTAMFGLVDMFTKDIERVDRSLAMIERHNREAARRLDEFGL